MTYGEGMPRKLHVVETPKEDTVLEELPVQGPPESAPARRGFGIITIQVDLDSPGFPITPNVSQNFQPSELVNTLLQMMLMAHAGMATQPLQQENEALKKEIEELRKSEPSELKE